MAAAELVFQAEADLAGERNHYGFVIEHVVHHELHLVDLVYLHVVVELVPVAAVELVFQNEVVKALVEIAEVEVAKPVYLLVQDDFYLHHVS